MTHSPVLAVQCFAWMYVSGLSFLQMAQSCTLHSRKWEWIFFILLQCGTRHAESLQLAACTSTAAAATSSRCCPLAFDWPSVAGMPVAGCDEPPEGGGATPPPRAPSASVPPRAPSAAASPPLGSAEHRLCASSAKGGAAASDLAVAAPSAAKPLLAAGAAASNGREAAVAPPPASLAANPFIPTTASAEGPAAAAAGTPAAAGAGEASAGAAEEQRLSSVGMDADEVESELELRSIASCLRARRSAGASSPAMSRTLCKNSCRFSRTSRL
mmetsp:Transcript_19263/g.48140  ORF Transcript_19263/g.48140 Transcript_19263/m.48140 type:complete len:271 (-) Transcript_19263:77-889(-)